MLAKIQRLELFAKNPDRLIIVDPEHDPSLNMFDVATDRFVDYSPIVREQVEAGIIELYGYIFGALGVRAHGQARNRLHVRRAAHACDAGRDAAYAPRLDGRFVEDLCGEPVREIRRSIGSNRSRILRKSVFQQAGVWHNAAADRASSLYGCPLRSRLRPYVFGVAQQHLDMFAAIQSQKGSLVNTSKSLLKTDASALFGRYMIAQVMAAAFERVAVPYSERKPAYLIIDEAASISTTA